ncbi:MAG: hypothetical protein GY899_03315 [Verrucomicrobiaceae bacterium]|nr:hypothetical protein [Verrucomicrobiaceae bacterium]
MIKNNSPYTKAFLAGILLIPVLLMVTTFSHARPLDDKARFFPVNGGKKSAAQKQSGYATGYGYTRAGALSDAIKNVPKGATRRAGKFAMEGKKWKCTIKWTK